MDLSALFYDRRVAHGVGIYSILTTQFE